MRRLAPLSLIAFGLAILPVPVHAQSLAVPVIGFLTTASPSSSGGPQITAFRDGLRQTGYTEGQNVRIEYRWAKDDYSLLDVLARELLLSGWL